MKLIKLIAVLILMSPALSYSQWAPSNNGLYGGTICLVAPDPSTGYLYTGTEYGGVFISTDNGSNWSQVNNGLIDGALTIRAFTFNGTNIFAGSWGSGVYLSANNGASWSPVNTGLTGNALFINSLAVSGTSIFAGTNGDGIYRSTDNGATWTAVNAGLSGSGLTGLTFAIKGTDIFLGTPAGVYISSDNGDNWTSVSNGLTGLGLDVRSLLVDGGNIFAGTYDGVYLSADNGGIWTAMNTGITNLYIRSLTISGTNLFAGTQDAGVFLSSNNGTSWAPANNGITGLSVRMINSLTHTGTRVFAGTHNGGVYFTENNGADWTVSNNGISGVKVNSLAIGDFGIVAGSLSGVYQSEDDGASWTKINTGLSGHGLSVYIVESFNNNIYIGTISGIFLYNILSGTWSYKSNGLTETDVRALAFTSDKIFAGTLSGGVFISEDNGDNWSAVNNGLTGFGLYIQALAVEGPNIFAGTFGAGIFLSTDNGANWTAVNNGLTGAGLTVSAIEVSGTDIYAGTGAGTYLSQDNGANWTRIDNTANVEVIEVMGSNIFAGLNSNGLRYSTDDGVNWLAENTGLTGTPGMRLWSLAIKTNNIFAGTYGGGVWKRPVSDLVTFDASPNILTIEETGSLTNIFSILSNTSWTISVAEPWLSADILSGHGNADITVTATENTVSDPRSANVTVSSTGLESEVIVVTQDGYITGLNELKKSEPKIYPVPANDVLFVESTGSDAFVSVYDISGMILIKKQLGDNQLDVSKLKQGVYFIKVTNSDGQSLKKFIKY